MNFSTLSRLQFEKYKSFDSPNYSFVDVWLPKLCAIHKDLFDNYSTKEDTDFNCEVCLHYYINDCSNNWEVCVSLVGPYAMITKKIAKNQWHLLSKNDEITHEDAQLISLLEKHGYWVLPESLLKTIIPEFVILDDEDGIPKTGAYLYQILFFYSNLNLLSEK